MILPRRSWGRKCKQLMQGEVAPLALAACERNTDGFRERLLTGTGATSAGAIRFDTATILGIAVVWIYCRALRGRG